MNLRSLKKAGPAEREPAEAEGPPTAPTRAPTTLSGRIRLALKPRIRELRFDMHLLSRSATSIAGMVLIIGLIIVWLFPTLFAPPVPGTSPYQIPLIFNANPPAPPNSHHIMGTGEYNADIYYGVIWGTQISFVFAVEVVILGALMGLILGLFAGYFGGVIDELIMRLTDIFLSIPGLILVMAIVAALGRGLGATKIALLITWWSGYTRLIRGTALSVRENSYVDAARASGSGELKIMFRHILPNSWTPVIVQATMDMGTVVLVLAGLSFLGLGAQPGYAEWGSMINQGQGFLAQGYWWMILFPGIAILMFVLAFNLMGDGLRDILDPKMRR